MRYHEGEKVIFHPERGISRRGTVNFDFEHRKGFLLVKLQGDPYSVYISENQIEKENQTMPAPTKTKTKTKARKRPAAVVEATEEPETSTDEAVEAPVRRRGRPKGSKNTRTTRPVKKAAASRKAAPVAKKAATRRTTATTKAKPGPKTMDRPLDNPFRPGSNSHHYTEALKRGGKRSVLVRNLLKKIDVHPWQAEEVYEDIHMEVDKRLTMLVKHLETKFGWIIERRGRGAESYVKGTPPSSAPAKSTARKAVAKKTTARKTAVKKKTSRAA